MSRWCVRACLFDSMIADNDRDRGGLLRRFPDFSVARRCYRCTDRPGEKLISFSFLSRDTRPYYYFLLYHLKGGRIDRIQITLDLTRPFLYYTSLRFNLLMHYRLSFSRNDCQG